MPNATSDMVDIEATQWSKREVATRSATRALGLLGERMASHPAYGVYVHADQQLRRVLDVLGCASLPDTDERQWLDIGLMASKELETADPELADALMDADYAFKHAT